MPDHELPPLGEDSNEDTVMHDSQRTQKNAPLPGDSQSTRANPVFSDDSQPTRANPVFRGDTERMTRRRTKLQRPVQQAQQQTQSPRQAPPGYRPRPKSRSSHDSLYLPWWSIALMLVAVLIISFAIVAAIYLFGNSGIIPGNATPIIRIVTAELPQDQPIVQPTAQPLSTQIISGGSPPANLQLQGPTLAPVQFSPTPVAIRIGSSVAVEGVDEQLLNVRDSTAINDSNVIFRAREGEIFTVVDGPAQGSGFTWWRIQDPDDPSRVGWAVSNYLGVIPN